MEGTGYWFETERSAREFVIEHFKLGARSFDVGCFQINYKWHGTSFRSFEHMFEPIENARYAAEFLKRLYLEYGDWSNAAGAYHSRTPKFANRYKVRFDRIHKQHPSAPDRDTETSHRLRFAEMPRQNNFPLLQHAGKPQTSGSLVVLPKRQVRALLPLSGLQEDS